MAVRHKQTVVVWAGKRQGITFAVPPAFVFARSRLRFCVFPPQNLLQAKNVPEPFLTEKGSGTYYLVENCPQHLNPKGLFQILRQIP